MRAAVDSKGKPSPPPPERGQEELKKEDGGVICLYGLGVVVGCGWHDEEAWV